MSESCQTYTAFAGSALLASGELLEVAAAICAAGVADRALVFDDETGRPVELDLRDGPEAAVADHARRMGKAPPRQGPGRPRLGVVAREVTLLPRHWEWLASQPGGASATLRRLVEEARRQGAGPDRARQAQEALYRVMSVLAGDLPGYEEALRALYAGDDQRLESIAAAWPEGVRTYVRRLAATERQARAAA